MVYRSLPKIVREKKITVYAPERNKSGRSFKLCPKRHTAPSTYIAGFIVALVVSLLVSSCSYQFSGSRKPPFGIRRVTIYMFENHTGETGVESIFTNDLIDELTRDGRMMVTRSDQAEAFFSGAVKSMDIETVSREESYTSRERRVKMAVDLKMKNPDGEILLLGKNITAGEIYAVVPDKLATEENRRAAILKISKEIAENAFQRLTWGF